MDVRPGMNREMGKGRKPLPGQVAELRGTRRRANRGAPSFDSTAKCEPPEHLSPPALAAWRELAPILEKAGLLNEAYAWTFAALCDAWARWVGACQACDQLGGCEITSNDKGNEYMHPAATLRMAAEKSLHRWLGEFGLSPLARSKVTADPKQAQTTLRTFGAPSFKQGRAG